MLYLLPVIVLVSLFSSFSGLGWATWQFWAFTVASVLVLEAKGILACRQFSMNLCEQLTGMTDAMVEARRR